MYLLVLLCFLAQEKLSKHSVRVRDGKGAGTLFSAAATALAVAANTSFCLKANHAALLLGCLRWVRL